MAVVILLLGLIAAISAFPADPVLMKHDDGLRFSYLEDDSGQAHLVDNWVKLSDLEKMARYNPDLTNQYHLFTRSNPTLSQPLVLNDVSRLLSSNFDPKKRTVVTMHGFIGSGTSEINQALMPAYLTAEDCNVIVLDWSSGSYWGPLATQAGQAAGRFINWLNSVTGSTPDQFTIVGWSVGGHGAGSIGRLVDGKVKSVIGLDAAERFDSRLILNPDDGQYVEAIHTSTIGEATPLGHVDFYPNGGRSQPGCLLVLCEHDRAFYYLAESVMTGGFTGQKCSNLAEAQSGNCNGESLQMGGLEPKTGKTGLYYVKTNSRRPFSQG